MWIGLDIGQNVNLIDSTLLKFLVFSKLNNWNDFDSVLFFIVVIYCSVDLTIDS